MLQLNDLEKITEKRKRVGRGGKRGRYCGRGKEGQKSRTGSGSEIKASFEGGQMPLARRIPRRGFNNPFQSDVKIISLRTLEDKFAAGDVVDKVALVTKGVIKGKGSFLIKVLGNGSLTKKLTVAVNAVSQSAQQAIEKAGGQVRLV